MLHRLVKHFFIVFVFKIPFDGLYDAYLETCFGIPSQFVFDLRWVNSITLIVAEAVLDKGDELIVDPVDSRQSVIAHNHLL